MLIKMVKGILMERRKSGEHKRKERGKSRVK